jgi:hypothetical protein
LNADSAGRNLLIGGYGLDTLQGGPGEEILVGGTTTYDGNVKALAAVMRQWASADSFDDRWSELDIGFTDPVAGFIQLRRMTVAYPKGKVLDDRVRDEIFGDAGSNWLLDFHTDATT